MSLDANIGSSGEAIGAARELAWAKLNPLSRLYCRVVSMLRTAQALLRMNVGQLIIQWVLYSTLISVFTNAARISQPGGKYIVLAYFLWGANLLLLLFIGEMRLSLGVCIYIAFLMLSGIYGIAYIGEQPSLFLKELVGISVCAVYFSCFFRSQSLSAYGIFEVYVNMATVVSVIAMIIFPLLLALGVRDNFGIRLHYPMTEPALFAMATIPALYYTISKLLKKDKSVRRRGDVIKFFILFVANMLAMSSIGYMDMLIMVAFILRRRKVLLITAPFICAAIGGILYFIVLPVQSRVDAALNFITSQDVGEAKNESVFIMAKSIFVATVGFMRHPIFGYGLGSFKMVHDQIISQLTGTGSFLQSNALLNSNSEDGNSILLRVMAELGSIGLILMTLFIWRFFPRGDSDRAEMGRGVLLIFFQQLVHGGPYFLTPTYFFVIAYVLLWYEDKRGTITGSSHFSKVKISSSPSRA